MQIYLPIAEMAVPAEVILTLGTVVGFLSSVFGVGGGFLATPFLIFLGLPAQIAVGTQAVQLVSSSFSGTLTHAARGNVDFKLGGVMLAGSVTGSFLGIGLFKLLQHFGQIDVVINILYVMLLTSIGSSMLFESLFALLKRNKPIDKERSSLWVRLGKKLPYQMHFPKSKLYMSALMPAGIGVVGGLLVSILGVGGGFVMVPAMIYILGMPTLLVTGTSLFQIMLTTAFATILHAATSQTVDIILALMLMLGGIIGTQLGVRAGKYIRGAPARLMLATMLILVALQLASNLFLQPRELFTFEAR